MVLRVGPKVKFEPDERNSYLYIELDSTLARKVRNSGSSPDPGKNFPVHKLILKFNSTENQFYAMHFPVKIEISDSCMNFSLFFLIKLKITIHPVHVFRFVLKFAYSCYMSKSVQRFQFFENSVKNTKLKFEHGSYVCIVNYNH